MRSDRDSLSNCYQNSLGLALENAIKSVAFPAISCGAYRYPIKEAARIALQTTRDFLTATDKLRRVIFVLATEEIFGAYEQLMKEL